MRRSWLLWLFLYLIDASLFILGFYLAFRIKFGAAIPYFNLAPFVQLIPYICLLVLVFFSCYDLYSPSWKRREETLYSVMITALLTNVATMVLSFIFRGFAFPRSVFLLAAALQIVILGIWRLCWQWLIDRAAVSKSMVVIGSNGEGAELARKLGNMLGRRYQIVGVFDGESEVAAACEAVSLAQVVCLNTSIPKATKEEIIARCLEQNKQVYLVPELYDILLHNATMSRVDDIPVFQIESLSLTPAQELLKRCFDLLLSLVVLVITSPLLLLVALGAHFSSPGPVFYYQERVGYNGATFRLFKFRTMVDNAEQHSGPVMAAEHDPRITGVGRFLRGARLDELPQLFNVFRGDMSFVGPRPERPFFVEQFSQQLPEYRYRLKVKPGITGMAQVQGKYGTGAAGKLRYDLYYIRNYSLLLDLQIILQTMRVVLIPDAAGGVAEGDRKRFVNS